MIHVELNADVGEETGGDDNAIIEVVDRVNVACGFHAGSPSTMRDLAALATDRAVAVGAHVSYLDREGFGRRSRVVDADVLGAQLRYQLGGLVAIAASVGARIDHVKAHGALYNDARDDRVLAELIVDLATGSREPMRVLAQPGSAVADIAGARGVPVLVEAFPDRAYRPDGSLLPRDLEGAVIADPDEVARRARRIARTGEIDAVDGTLISLPVDTLCVHGDSPHAVACARAVRAALD